MDNKKTLGNLIEKEVKRQGWGVKEFGRAINCERNNVYNIFKRNSIDVQLLGKISKVLNHNFFADVANDLGLVESAPETEEEKDRRLAFANFMEFVPDVLEELGKSRIMLPFSIMRNSKDSMEPDFMLDDAVEFRYGMYMADYIDRDKCSCKMFEDENGNIFYYIFSDELCDYRIDAKMEVRTKGEWYVLLKRIYEVVKQEYPKELLVDINDIMDE